MSSPPAPARRRSSDPGDLWASLPEDLVSLLAFRLLAGGGDLQDYVRFRAVCTGWRSGAVSPRGRGVTDPRFHPRRWMMLPEGHCLHPGHPALRGHARFVNLGTGALVRARVPLLDEYHCAIDSVDGLLLLLGDQYQQGTVRLLHPFTGDVTEFPPLATLLRQLAGTELYSCPVLYRIKRLASRVSASASYKDGVVTVVLALDRAGRVAFATSLDQQWNLPSWEDAVGGSPLASQGKLYALRTLSSYGHKEHQVLQIDPPVPQDAGFGFGGTLQPPKLIATISESDFPMPEYLVECDSEILVLGYKDVYMSQILVCKLADLVQQRFIPIRSIGDNTLLLGSERCMSVSSKVLSTVRGGSIVVCAQRYLAQYHLRSGTWSPAIDDCSLYGRAQGPSSLVHYIYSCCTRSLWNRGIVFRMKE